MHDVALTYRRRFTAFVSIVILIGSTFHMSPAQAGGATGWIDPDSPGPATPACIEGTTGTTGMISVTQGGGSGDSWAWGGITGDENNFSITLIFNEGGLNLSDGPNFYELWMAFREVGQTCTGDGTLFWPMFWYDPLPPVNRFNVRDECTLTLEADPGAPTGTLTFTDYQPDKPEFQNLRLELLEASVEPGEVQYVIGFECAPPPDDPPADDPPGSGWDLDLSRYLTRAESSLPDTR